MEKKNNIGKAIGGFFAFLGIIAAIGGACALALKLLKKRLKFSVELFEDEEEQKDLENKIKITQNPIEDAE